MIPSMTPITACVCCSISTDSSVTKVKQTRMMKIPPSFFPSLFQPTIPPPPPSPGPTFHQLSQERYNLRQQHQKLLPQPSIHLLEYLECCKPNLHTPQHSVILEFTMALPTYIDITVPCLEKDLVVQWFPQRVLSCCHSKLGQTWHQL